MLAGVVLAGGLSSRMGCDKGQLRISPDGLNLLAKAQEQLTQLGVQQVLISGHQHPDGIPDLYPARGPLSGIHGVLAAIHKQKHRISELIVLPVDMPKLSCVVLAKLVEAGRVAQKACCYRRCYLPLYLPVTHENQLYINHLMEKGGDYSLHHLLATLEAVQISVDDPGVLLNINKPQQWRDFIKQSANRV